jgi:hypothetical protein
LCCQGGHASPPSRDENRQQARCRSPKKHTQGILASHLQEPFYWKTVLTFFVGTLWELGWKVWTWWTAGTLLLNLIVLPPFILIGNSCFAFGFTSVLYVCGSLLMQAGLGSGHSVVLNSAGLMSLGAFYRWLHWFVGVSMGIETNWWQWLYFCFPFYLCGYSLCALSILNLVGFFVRLCLKTRHHAGSTILPL